MAVELGEVAERLRRSTVEVVDPAGRSGGTGVLWPNGRILTAAHVLRGETADVRAWDGRQTRARVARRNPHLDLALLESASAGAEAPTVRPSCDVRVGEVVLAVGNPLGFVGALSTGVVHAIGPVRGLGPRHWIQSQIRLAPGNSGGPLADAHGRVIGINTMLAHGIGLAIPSDAVSRFAESASEPKQLGVTVRPVESGLLVLEVSPGSPAARASLLPGDILADPMELQNLLAEQPASMRLSFLRGDRRALRQTTVNMSAEAA